MNKAVRTLFFAVIAIGIVSIGLTYYRTVTLRAYTVIGQEDAAP